MGPATVSVFTFIGVALLYIITFFGEACRPTLIAAAAITIIAPDKPYSKLNTEQRVQECDATKA